MVRKTTSHSPSSSIDSSNHPLSLSCTRSESSSCSSSSSFCHSSNCKTKTRDLSTDLRLGLSITPNNSPRDTASELPQREQRFDWPPIKPLLRSALAGKLAVEYCPRRPSYFVKVYMEGVPIGRKLDLFSHNSYDDLVTSLSQMFRTSIQRPSGSRSHCDGSLVLTYEDKEGDWMMVGDVPWEMFVITVKRLKITRADRC